MIAEISAGLGSLKAAKDILQALNGVQTVTAVNDVKFALQGHLLEAQQSLFLAQEAQSATAARIRDLEKEVAQLKEWSTEKERYELSDLGRGAFAYILKRGMEAGQPPHWLCTNCFDSRHKSILQFRGQDRGPGGGRGDTSTYGCDQCKASIRVYYTVKPEQPLVHVPR